MPTHAGSAGVGIGEGVAAALAGAGLAVGDAVGVGAAAAVGLDVRWGGVPGLPVGEAAGRAPGVGDGTGDALAVAVAVAVAVGLGAGVCVAAPAGLGVNAARTTVGARAVGPQLAESAGLHEAVDAGELGAGSALRNDAEGSRGADGKGGGERRDRQAQARGHGHGRRQRLAVVEPDAVEGGTVVGAWSPVRLGGVPRVPVPPFRLTVTGPSARAAGCAARRAATGTPRSRRAAMWREHASTAPPRDGSRSAGPDGGLRGGGNRPRQARGLDPEGRRADSRPPTGRDGRPAGYGGTRGRDDDGTC